MTEQLHIATEQIVPERADVFENQGIPPDADVSAEVERLYSVALRQLADVAEPRAVLGEVTVTEFEAIYAGEGDNDARTPVGDIYPNADRLVLFAVTLGEAVCQRVGDHFAGNDFALGAMLDSVASAAADRLAEVVQERCGEMLRADGWSRNGGRVLRYSPGYCGWHVSGQRRLFEALRPERIGIRLTESCLMQPLKSVSGVIIAGDKGLHCVAMDYACCAECKTHGCRERSESSSERLSPRASARTGIRGSI